MLGIAIGIAAFLALSMPAILFIIKYPKSAHWPAFIKAFFLWLVSTSPVIGGILLSKPIENEAPIVDQFQIDVLASFTISEMFVYSAAFISPVLYVIFDIIRNYNEDGVKLDLKDLSKYLRGMQGVVLSSVFILILTLLAYASSKSDPAGFSQTYLALFLTDKGYIVYVASVLVWYSVILWETSPKNQFGRSQEKEAKNFSDDYAKRRGQ